MGIYTIGADPEADEIVLTTLCELKTCWQSFAADPMPERKRSALQRLTICGFAQFKMAYRIADTRSGEWHRFKFVVSGQFVGDPVMRMIAAQCPRDWFTWTRDLLTAADTTQLRDEPHNWLMAITDDGDLWRKGLPANRNLILNHVHCYNAEPHVLKDGSESGCNAVAPADDSFTEYRSPPDWQQWLISKGRSGSPTSWNRFKPHCGGENHPVSGSRQVRFKISRLAADGLSYP